MQEEAEQAAAMILEDEKLLRQRPGSAGLPCSPGAAQAKPSKAGPTGSCSGCSSSSASHRQPTDPQRLAALPDDLLTQPSYTLRIKLKTMHGGGTRNQEFYFMV